MVKLSVNEESRSFEGDPQMPVLWYLRDELGMTGTKFGCGMALCGACTVLIDGNPVRACLTPVGSVEGKNITTIEAAERLKIGQALQEAWIAEQAPQCGYCQSGQIMSAIALLSSKPKPTDDDINAAMSGNICRCGTYGRIRSAIHRAADALQA